MRTFRLFIAVLAAAAVYVPAASAAQLDSQLDKIARQFAQDASSKLPDLNPVTVAVFPFQADDALAKRKVDVAVGELLTQKLIREVKFRLLERSQLDAVLREQKLGLSGAIESETAAKVGKLAGARLAAMGTVTRLGKNYQISAKLVDTDTAEVVSVSIVEVKKEVFDEEAARYLVLVPDTQTLSIYFALGNVPMKVKNLPAATVNTKPVVPANVKTGMTMDSGLYPGFGLKYFPFSRWDVDFAILPKFKIGDTKKSVVSGLDPVFQDNTLLAKAEGQAFRLMVNRQFKVSPHFNAYAGAGFMRFELDPPSEDMDNYNMSHNLVNGNTIQMAGNFGQGRFLSPLASLGMEWKPQSRFGLSLLGTFPLKSDKYTWDAVINKGLASEKTITVWEMSYPKYMAEINLSWYF